MAHIRLGELLMRAGHLSEEGLTRALEEQKKWGGRLGRILREMNLVTEEVLLKALTKQLGLPRADLSAPEIPSEVLARIEPAFAVENRLCPERYEGATRTLTVAMEDHLRLDALDELAAKTGLRLETSLATGPEIDAALARLYPTHPAVMPAKQNMAIFETKDFSTAVEGSGSGIRTSTVRMLETADFSEAAKALKEETPPQQERMKYFTTDDFSDAANKVRGDDD